MASQDADPAYALQHVTQSLSFFEVAGQLVDAVTLQRLEDLRQRRGQVAERGVGHVGEGGARAVPQVGAAVDGRAACQPWPAPTGPPSRAFSLRSRSFCCFTRSGICFVRRRRAAADAGPAPRYCVRRVTRGWRGGSRSSKQLST